MHRPTPAPSPSWPPSSASLLTELISSTCCGLATENPFSKERKESEGPIEKEDVESDKEQIGVSWGWGARRSRHGKTRGNTRKDVEGVARSLDRTREPCSRRAMRSFGGMGRVVW